MVQNLDFGSWIRIFFWGLDLGLDFANLGRFLYIEIKIRILGTLTRVGGFFGSHILGCRLWMDGCQEDSEDSTPSGHPKIKQQQNKSIQYTYHIIANHHYLSVCMIHSFDDHIIVNIYNLT